MYSFLFSPACAASLTQLILFNFTTLIIFGKEDNMKLLITRFSKSCCYFHPLRSRYSQHNPVSSLCVSWMWVIKFYTRTKQQAKLFFRLFWSLYFYAADRKTKGSELNGREYSPILLLHLISSLVKFDFLVSNHPTDWLTGWPTDQLTPWSRFLPEQLTCPQLLKKFPAFYRTRRFITTLHFW